MVKKHVILMIVLAVLKESHPLNPEILKYDRYMKDFEATGRQLKREKNEEMNPLIVKRQDQSNFVTSATVKTTTDRKDPNEGRNVICWLTANNFTSVCKEILNLYENSSITLNEDAEIEYCSEFIYMNPRRPEFGPTVWARKCPTEPPFYVSDAHVWYSVFTFKPVEGGLNRTHIIGGLRALGYVPDDELPKT